MAKPKTIPALEPNAGLRASLQRKIDALIRAQTRAAASALLSDLVDSGEATEPAPMTSADALAQDARLTPGIIEKAKRAFVASRPESAVKRLDLELAEQMARWMIHAGENAKAVSKWFVRAAAQNVTASQRRALIRAGISPQLLKEKWKVPVVKNRYVSPTAAKAIPKLVDDMTGLITKMQADDLARLREIIVEGITQGQSLGEIEQTLAASEGFSAARAKRVALDQSIKVNQGIQQANAEDLGIKTAIWVHVPGRYSSRETHIAMDGKRFNIREGLYDSDVDKKVVPGELPFCFPRESNVANAAPILKLFRRFYVGELTELVTESGVSLSSTPNHPILTSRGWIGAKDLKVGDYLVNVSSQNINRWGFDKKESVSEIGALFDSLKLIGCPSLKLSGSNGQFHGDGTDSEVDVVDVYRFLANGFEPGGAEGLIKLIFSRAKETGKALFVDGLLNKDCLAFCCPSSSVMRLFNKRMALLAGHLGHTDVVCLGTVAAIDIVHQKETSNFCSGHSILFGERENGPSFDVLIDNFRRKGVFLLKDWERDPARLCSFADRQDAGMVSFGDFRRKPSVEYFCDGIVEIRNRGFSGHVYNLETTNGWYTCNSIAVHNCRCIFRYDIDELLK